MIAFGNYAFVLQNLARSATDCNGIASYCVYWVLSLIDYYEATGDAAALALYTPNAIDKLETAYGIFDDLRTSLTFAGWDDRLGAGFMNATTTEAEYDYRFLVLRAWGAWAATMSAAGNATGSAHYGGYVAEKGAWLRAALGGDAWPRALGTHAAAEALNAPGFATPAEAGAILGAQLNDAVRVCSLSNFNQYWILQALGNGGAMDKAVASVHRCWGAELALGATSFWEVSSPDWLEAFPTGPASSIPHPIPYGENGQTSLCHPWSAGAAPWLSSHVLGVRPLAPGFAAVAVAPHLTLAMAAAAGGLRGAVTTPRGAVYLSVEPAAIRLTTPDRVAAQLRLSEVLLLRLGWLRHGARLASSGNAAGAAEAVSVQVSVDGGAPVELRAAAGLEGPLFEGELAALGAGRSAVAVLDLPSTGGAVVVTLVSPRAAAAPPTPESVAAAAAPAFPPPSWPARVVAIDTWTQGEWVGRFGAEGFVLASFSNASSPAGDASRLPPWVAWYRQIRDSNSWLLPNPNADPRALQAPSGAAADGRAIGCWYAGMTDFVDVALTAAAEGTWWRLAVYLVDYDAGQPSHESLRNRRATVALMDLATLEPAAPTQYLDAFVGGTWVVFELNSSARVRVSQLEGDNAVISALAFDLVEVAGLTSASLRL